MTTAATIIKPVPVRDDAPSYRIAAPSESLRDRQAESPAGPAPTAPAQPPAGNLRRRAVIAGVAAAIAGVAATAYYLRCVAPFESTDDAFIEGHVTPIAPQVAGRVVELAVADNQEVRQGDLLLQIDPRDAQAQLDQARAALAAARSRHLQAQAQLAVDDAHIAQEQAGITAADSEAQRAGADARRYERIARSAISESQLDFTAAAARSSAAQVEVARDKLVAAQAQLALGRVALATADAEAVRAAAVVAQAELALSYTRVTAPESGVVTHRTVEPGAYVQTGQALLAIVPHQVWVTANFKETQLARMRPGQAVTLTIDAYPQAAFTGHVDSIQSGSGPRFSLLPPENATGNFVKTVQRVPVKIVIDGVPDPAYVLGPGMSVVPEVRVR